jgi:hypothetical protein
MELQFPESLNMRIAASKGKSTLPTGNFVAGSILHHHGQMGVEDKKKKYKANLNEEKISERKKEGDKNVNQFKQKFGMLKKASVLMYYGRYNDAFDQIAKAAEIIKK